VTDKRSEPKSIRRVVDYQLELKAIRFNELQTLDDCELKLQSHLKRKLGCGTRLDEGGAGKGVSMHWNILAGRGSHILWRRVVGFLRRRLKRQKYAEKNLIPRPGRELGGSPNRISEWDQ